MRITHEIAVVFVVVATLLSFVPKTAMGQDADLKEVQRYALTEAGLARYAKATHDVAALPSARTRACADADDDESDTESIAGMVAKLDATPGAKAAIQSAGMTTREYVVFSMSLLQNGLAAWAVQQPGGKLPPGVSQANVDFVTKHDAELKQLGEATRASGKCEGGG